MIRKLLGKGEEIAVNHMIPNIWTDFFKYLKLKTFWYWKANPLKREPFVFHLQFSSYIVHSIFWPIYPHLSYKPGYFI